MKVAILLSISIALLMVKVVDTSDSGHGLRKHKGKHHSHACPTRPEDPINKFYDLFLDASDPEILDEMMDLFTDDAIVLHVHQPTVQGKDAIRALFEMATHMPSASMVTDFEIQKIWQSGRIAAVYVNATIAYTLPVGREQQQQQPPVEVRVREMYTLEKKHSCFQISALISNEDTDGGMPPGMN